jgi:hypothetical protein
MIVSREHPRSFLVSVVDPKFLPPSIRMSIVVFDRRESEMEVVLFKNTVALQNQVTTENPAVIYIEREKTPTFVETEASQLCQCTFSVFGNPTDF